MSEHSNGARDLSRLPRQEQRATAEFIRLLLQVASLANDIAAHHTLVRRLFNTHACIRVTVIDVHQRDRDVLLAQDCIDSHDEQHPSVSMRYMDGEPGVAMNNEQIDAELQKSWSRNLDRFVRMD